MLAPYSSRAHAVSMSSSFFRSARKAAALAAEAASSAAETVQSKGVSGVYQDAKAHVAGE